MNRKKIRAHKKKRRYCDAAQRTRSTNGLTDPKVIYDTEEEAWEAIRSHSRNAVLTLEQATPYLCRHTKDHYHIGRLAKSPDTSKDDLINTLLQIPGAAQVLKQT